MSTDAIVPVEHEFNDLDNALFTELNRWMLICAMGWGVLGSVFTLVGLAAFSLYPLVVGVTGVILSAVLWMGRGSFQLIVQTEGSDIAHLLCATRSIRSYFKVMSLSFIVALLVALAISFGG